MSFFSCIKSLNFKLISFSINKIVWNQVFHKINSFDSIFVAYWIKASFSRKIYFMLKNILNKFNQWKWNLKQSWQCINEIIYQKFLESGCLPKNHKLMTYVFDNHDYTKWKHRICVNTSFEIREKSLLRDCLEGWIEELYQVWYSEKSIKFDYLYRDNFPSYATIN
jgi:hypothetical protein